MFSKVNLNYNKIGTADIESTAVNGKKNLWVIFSVKIFNFLNIFKQIGKEILIASVLKTSNLEVKIVCTFFNAKESNK